MAKDRPDASVTSTPSTSEPTSALKDENPSPGARCTTAAPSSENSKVFIWSPQMNDVSEVCASCPLRSSVNPELTEMILKGDPWLTHLLSNKSVWSRDVSIYLTTFQGFGKQNADLIGQIRGWEVRCGCAECEAQRSQSDNQAALYDKSLGNVES
jgi:hypothetical protein